jgi:hypothetical protein
MTDRQIECVDTLIPVGGGTHSIVLGIDGRTASS